jgi:branched-chain amino acid transport system permease protein
MHKPFASTIKSFHTPLLLCSLLFVVTIAVALFGTSAFERTVVEIFIRIILVVGLYIFIGNSGIMSFGHVGFMCIGAYAAAWQTVLPAIKNMMLSGLPSFLLEHTVPVFAAAILSGLLAAVVALLVGLIIMRLTGIAASIATFAFLAVVNVVYSNWDSITGGTSSVIGIPTYIDVWVAFGWAAAAVVIAAGYSASRFGLALRAVREEPAGAQACGVNVFRARLIAFVLSAFVVGIAGVLDAHFLGVVNPDAYYLGKTFIALAMLVVGGVGSLSGAVSGVVSISVLMELLIRLEQGIAVGATRLSIPNGVQEIAIGIAMMLILIYRPSGLMGARELRLPRFSRRADTSVSSKKLSQSISAASR